MNETTPIEWEVAVGEGLRLVETLGESRIQLGALAYRVTETFGEQNRYGKAIVQTFAGEIGTSPRTVREARQFYMFYGEYYYTLRDELANISYSHMRLAMRLGELDNAVEALRYWSEYNYTVAQAEYSLRPDTDDDKTDTPAFATTGTIRRNGDGTYALQLDAGNLPDGARVQVVVMEDECQLKSR